MVLKRESSATVISREILCNAIEEIQKYRLVVELQVRLLKYADVPTSAGILCMRMDSTPASPPRSFQCSEPWC